MIGVANLILNIRVFALSYMVISVIGSANASGSVAPSVAITGIPIIHSLLR